MTAVRFRVDIKEAMLAGHDPGSGHAILDVTAEDFGADLWPVLVGSLLSQPMAGGLISSLTLRVPTIEGVKEAVAKALADRTAETTSFVSALQTTLATITDLMKQPPERAPVPLPIDLRGNMPYGTTFDGYARRLPYDVSPRTGNLLPERLDEINLLLAQIEYERKRNMEEIEAMNRAEAERVAPAMREKHAEAVAIAAKQAAEAAIEKEKRMTAAAAARLESGYWETTTPSYNSRRYGKPWCARVTGVSGSGLTYEWADSVGGFGAATLLRARCQPGGIIAWGQKDNRNPSKSEHHILQMQPDGSMEEIDKTEAYRILTSDDS